jgi:ribose-phosphate pyrophosphokinase
LKEAGASTVIAVAGHPVFSGPAIERLQKSNLEKVVVTDTIQLQPAASDCEKIVVCTVADVLAEAIRSIHFQDSVSRLFV